MRNLVLAGVVVLLCAVAGCTTTAVRQGQDGLPIHSLSGNPILGPEEQGQATPSKEDQEFVIAREFSQPGAYLGPMPTLTLVMKPYDSVRNKATCEAFFKLKTVEEATRTRTTWQFLVMRVPLLKSAKPTDVCDTVVPNYDFYQATELLLRIQTTAVGTDGKKLDTSGAGPFIIEQYVTSKGVGYVVSDMSKVGPSKKNKDGTFDQKDLDKAFVDLAPKFAQAIAQQQYDLAADPGTAVAGITDKGGSGNWLDYLCSAMNSRLGLVIKAGFELYVSAAVTKVFEAIEQPACPSDANKGGTSNKGGSTA